MSYIIELNLRESIDPADWLLIDTPTETMRVSAGTLSSWIGGIKTINNIAPESGNVNLTPDQISDIASGKKFVTQAEKTKIALISNVGSGSLFLADDGTYKAPAASSGGLWGTINGDITTQTDLYNLFQSVWNDFGSLNTLLGTKQNILGFTPEDSAQKGLAGGYVPLDNDAKISASYLPEDIGGVVSYRAVFRFDSDMFTEDEAVFRGAVTNMSIFFNNQLSGVAFQARTESGAYSASMNIVDLQNWINANVTGNASNGTVFFIKSIATYKTNIGYSGLSECVLYYKN